MSSEQAQEALRILRESGQLDDDVRHQLLDLLVPPARPPKMSYEEFLAWADEDTRAEWVDGDVIMTSPSSLRHQEIAGFLYELMRAYNRARHLGKVLQPPFQMKLAHSGREPDLIYVSKEHLQRLHETYLEGPADLAVEIMSPESAGRDRGDKFYEYQEAGVAEYWLIDPERRWAEYYALSETGRYQVALGGAEGTYYSSVLEGFWLKTEWLWLDEQPDPVAVLAEILGSAQ